MVIICFGFLWSRENQTVGNSIVEYLIVEIEAGGGHTLKLCNIRWSDK